jgi:hypothetical protein
MNITQYSVKCVVYSRLQLKISCKTINLNETLKSDSKLNSNQIFETFTLRVCLADLCQSFIGLIRGSYSVNRFYGKCFDG